MNLSTRTKLIVRPHRPRDLVTTPPDPPPAPPADTRLTGLLVSSDRFWGLRKSGAVTRLCALPPEVLANSRLPSREVMGRLPPEVRAVGRRTTA